MSEEYGYRRVKNTSNNDIESKQTPSQSWMRRFFWPLFLGLTTIMFMILFIVFAALYGSQTNNINVIQEDFDYVVIGSGAGGAASAYQVSSNPKVSVIILEAGPPEDNNPLISEVINAGGLEQYYFNEFFWQNTQNGNKDAPGVDMYTGGRLGGGSTSINGMIWDQQSNWIWDFVYNTTGQNDLWNSSSIINSFKEMQTLICNSCNSQNHGYSGPLTILESMITPPQTTPTTLSQKLALAFNKLTGLPILGDYNNMTDSNRVGSFTDWQMSAFPNGTRCSSTRCIIGNILKARSNVQTRYNSFVTKLKFDSNNKITQVYYVTDGHITRIINVKKEVILAAGVGTPAILLHSGIGNIYDLYGIGVKPVVADNPLIGVKTWNHQIYTATFTRNASDIPSANPNDLYEGGAFMPLAPNFTFTYPPTEVVGPRAFQFIGINTPSPTNLMAVSALNVVPQSVGNLFIRNNDPLRPVAQNDNLYVGLGGQNDLQLALSLYQYYFCGLNTQFQTIDTSYVMIDPPASYCSNITLLTSYVTKYLPSQSYHWTGQCPIGTSVFNGVADPLGRVFGVSGVRIADATLLGRAADGNTQAVSYMFGWNIGKAIR